MLHNAQWAQDVPPIIAMCVIEFLKHVLTNICNCSYYTAVGFFQNVGEKSKFFITWLWLQFSVCLPEYQE